MKENYVTFCFLKLQAKENPRKKRISPKSSGKSDVFVETLGFFFQS